MNILRQPNNYHFDQPLLNRVLGVYVAIMHSGRIYDDGIRRESTSITFYDFKTREVLDYSSWRVKIIRRLGKWAK